MRYVHISSEFPRVHFVAMHTPRFISVYIVIWRDMREALDELFV